MFFDNGSNDLQVVKIAGGPACRPALYFSRNDNITWHVFTGVTSCFHDKIFIVRFMFTFLYQTINMFNPEPIETLQTYLMLIFSAYWWQICQTAYSQTMFSNFGLNVWRTETKIAFH